MGRGAVDRLPGANVDSAARVLELAVARHAPSLPLAFVDIVGRCHLPTLAVPLPLLPLPVVDRTHGEGTTTVTLALVVDELALIKIAAAVDLYRGVKGVLKGVLERAEGVLRGC